MALASSSSQEPLTEHPVFSFQQETSGELHLHDLQSHSPEWPEDLSPASQVMAVRGYDIILANGKEIRIASLTGGAGSPASFKTLDAPCVDFAVKTLCLSPNGKLLAVAGARQVAVVVLPRTSYGKLVNPVVPCKSIRVGGYYHSDRGSSVIAKIDWHPWGEGESSLLVMTTDGALREYDMAVDAEEPQQTINFFPPRTHRKGYKADDEASEEIASFCFGKGKADWGRLTVYAVTRRAEVFAFCPFLPFNAAVPDVYLQALECFVSTKRAAFATKESSMGPAPESTLYDLQFKYVKALSKQMPSSSSTTSPRIQSRIIHLHPPTSIKYAPVRQGPFLFQPAPVDHDEDDDVFACDIAYIGLGDVDAEDLREEQLGVVLISSSDGKVDICLDTEKVEAQWDTNQAWNQGVEPPLPVLTVNETIDLGLVNPLEESGALSLLKGNEVKLHADPLHEGVVYATHAFGAHSLDMSKWLGEIAGALQIEEMGDRRRRRSAPSLEVVLRDQESTEVRHLVTTLDPDAKTSAPIIALCVINNAHVIYSLFALTATYQLVQYDLSSKAALDPVPPSPPTQKLTLSVKASDEPPDDKRPYISLLEKAEFKLPSLGSTAPKIAPTAETRLMTPNTLRFLGEHAGKVQARTRELGLAIHQARERASLQKLEFSRQIQTLQTIVSVTDRLTETGSSELMDRAKQVVERQEDLNRQFDRMLQRLMDNSSPTLSEFEVKWFAELAKMNQEVFGSTDGKSLKSRAEAVIHRQGLLRKDVEELASQEAVLKKDAIPMKLGTIQVKGIERRLAMEHHLLEDGKRKMDDLATMLDRFAVA